MHASAQEPSPIRVMLVDDSAIIRGMISRGLSRNEKIQIVATASDGDMAINSARRYDLDVILLDVEMPNKDGLEALPELKAIAPNAHIVMVSSLTQRNAKISLKAMELGATDYLAKPSSTGDGSVLDEFYRALEQKVLALGEAAKRQRQQGGVAVAARPIASATPRPAPKPAEPPVTPKPAALVGRKNVLAIASSTGGPQALHKLLKLIKDDVSRVPVLITQHMPATFTALLAEHIQAETGLQCQEGKEGDAVQAGRVYIAPGGYHMVIEKDATGGAKIHLIDGAPVNFCKPAADPMFDSIAQYYGRNTMTVVLTGMGNDGCKGAKNIKDVGGYVMIQDKETSVVWGMPGAIAAEGFQDAVGPIEAIAETIKQAVR